MGGVTNVYGSSSTSVDVVQQVAKLTQSTNISNKVRQTELPQSVDSSQLNISQPLANYLSDTETIQNFSNVRFIDPNNAPLAQQLSSELATTDITCTNISDSHSGELFKVLLP